MIFDKGIGRIYGPIEVGPSGSKYVLPGPTQYVKIAVNGSAKMYLTQDDFDNGTNYWPLQGDSSSAVAFEAPVCLTTVWLQADVTVEVTFFVGTTI